MTEQEIMNVIKTERKRQGIMAYELSAKSGVSYGTVSKWERGETGGQLANIIAVLDTLGMALWVRRKENG